MNHKVGYYKVKFYNHDGYYILYWTGTYFQQFVADKIPHDEIESTEYIVC